MRRLSNFFDFLRRDVADVSQYEHENIIVEDIRTYIPGIRIPNRKIVYVSGGYSVRIQGDDVDEFPFYGIPPRIIVFCKIADFSRYFIPVFQYG